MTGCHITLKYLMNSCCTKVEERDDADGGWLEVHSMHALSIVCSVLLKQLDQLFHIRPDENKLNCGKLKGKAVRFPVEKKTTYGYDLPSLLLSPSILSTHT